MPWTKTIEHPANVSNTDLVINGPGNSSQVIRCHDDEVLTPAQQTSLRQLLIPLRDQCLANGGYSETP